MKLLLDHCVPHSFARHLPEHEVSAASELGWQKLRNGELLRAAAGAGFVALLTTDQRIKHQQNMAHLPIAVIVLIAQTNKLSSLLPLLPRLSAVLGAQPVPRLIELE